MTPAQQAALESLVDRALLPDEMATIDGYLHDRNDTAIANILSLGRTRPVLTPIGYGTVLETLAPNGGAFLDAMEALAAADPNIKWGMRLLEASNLDIGNPVVRSMLSQIGDAQPSIAGAIAALLARSDVTDPVPVSAVSDALNKVTS